MADKFNPITDLQPVDPFNVPVGQSSEEVESIRVKLVVTRNKTAELVNILKKKNISFNKDIDTIRELNRRLMRTIPRIPILRGDASTQTNRLEDISIRKGQFDLNVPLIPKPDAKIPQRLLNFAVDIILTFYGGRIITPILRRLGILKLIPPKLLEKLIKTKPNPNKVIPFLPIRKPVTPKVPLKVAKVFGNKRVISLTKDIKGKVQSVQNAFARGDRETAVILADEAFAVLNAKKIKLLENFGKIPKPTEVQKNNFFGLIKEFDMALKRINEMKSAFKIPVPSKTRVLDLTKDKAFKPLDQIIKEFEMGNFTQGSLFNMDKFNTVTNMKGSMFKNLQLDDEINRYLYGSKYIEKIKINKNIFSSIKKDTFTQNNFFIVDDTFQF